MKARIRTNLGPDDGERLDFAEERVHLFVAFFVGLDARRTRVGRHKVREEPGRLAVVVHLEATKNRIYCTCIGI